MSASGAGFSWASFGPKEQNIGFIVTSSLAKEDKSEFNYGAGLQLDVPTTNIYTEFNIKRVMGDFNKTNMYFGVGYHLSNTFD
ncbi:hypothetical protein VXS05_00510 [Photobacterium toruni]|uniref:hypothetical protein n=1 Tax=Photobacterium toruni TaxID=1935446 RepID=UPI002E1738AF|nr:hypothetical protein [Photobacterium toruni]